MWERRNVSLSRRDWLGVLVLLLMMLGWVRDGQEGLHPWGTWRKDLAVW